MLWYVGRFLATYKLNCKVESIAHAREEPVIKPWNDPTTGLFVHSQLNNRFFFFFGDMDMQLRKKGIIGDFRRGHEACPCL